MLFMMTSFNGQGLQTMQGENRNHSSALLLALNPMESLNPGSNESSMLRGKSVVCSLTHTCWIS
jgi:hypothetical protein